MNREGLSEELLNKVAVDLSKAYRDGYFAVLWYENDNKETIYMFVNGNRAWIMYLSGEDDIGYHTYNAALKTDTSFTKFILDNGQMDEYPTSWCLDIAEARKVMAYFLEFGGSAPWIIWKKSGES